ncbi:MAG: hypothetical protein LBP70_03185 [Mycoplasmataceae bacterium]|jgi:hypothetical protein|nr:hypothetical protein [Mycoplasmataceae bacterium]
MTRKKNHINKSKSIQQKVDDVKLLAHVDAVKTGKHTNVLQELEYRASSLRKALNETSTWAKKVKLRKQTMKLLDLLTEGAGVFLLSLIRETKNGR